MGERVMSRTGKVVVVYVGRCGRSVGEREKGEKSGRGELAVAVAVAVIGDEIRLQQETGQREGGEGKR